MSANVPQVPLRKNVSSCSSSLDTKVLEELKDAIQMHGHPGTRYHDLSTWTLLQHRKEHNFALVVFPADFEVTDSDDRPVFSAEGLWQAMKSADCTSLSLLRVLRIYTGNAMLFVLVKLLDGFNVSIFVQ